MDRTIVIGTRSSQLALWQARYARQQLEQAGHSCQIREISTQGDRKKEVSFSQLQGVGFFTKEIELALLNEEIDVAVHSHKDLATDSPEGLTIAAVSYRAAPNDLVIVHPDAVDTARPLSFQKNAQVGTSSPRRRSQVLAFRPDATLENLRGNVHTRVQKLRDRQHDAIVMAQAGIERGEVNLEGLYVEELAPQYFIPAAAQGVLAYQIRDRDEEINQVLQAINDKAVARTTGVERAILSHLEGGCQLPYGAYCQQENGQYQVWVSKADEWQEMPQRLFVKGDSPDQLTETVVRKLDRQHPTSIFMTRDIDKDRFFYRCLTAHQYDVKGTSLIEFTPIEQGEPPATDWIFLTSPKAVRFFARQVDLEQLAVRWGVTGSGTAQVLRQYGATPNFTGEGKDTKAIGKAFGQRAQGQTVLFPMNQDSLRSIQKGAGKQIQAIDWPVYKSCPKEQVEIPETEIVVFTSPKNVHGYFQQTSLQDRQQAIAIGPKTGQALQKNGVKDYHLPYTPGLVPVLDVIFTL